MKTKKSEAGPRPAGWRPRHLLSASKERNLGEQRGDLLARVDGGSPRKKSVFADEAQGWRVTGIVGFEKVVFCVCVCDGNVSVCVSVSNCAGW